MRHSIQKDRAHAMVPIHDLSNELLDIIFSRLGKIDLLNVVQTCRNLRISADRHLYHRIVIVVPKSDNDDGSKWLPVHSSFHVTVAETRTSRHGSLTAFWGFLIKWHC